MKRSLFTGSLLAFGAAGGGRALAENAVTVLYAGSLVTVVERSLAPALARRGITVDGEAKGSLALANLIKSGLRTPDVFISADAKAIDGLLGTETGAIVKWYATFAATRIVVGYAPSSTLAHSFEAVGLGRRRLTDVLLQPKLKLGRTDPKVDPKGYRTIVAAKLLSSDANATFASKLLGHDDNASQIFPEETLLARLETGTLDAAFLYATEAIARKMPYVELPASANLGDPALAAHYATASVTIDGVKRTGGLSVYALTIPAAARNADGAAAFVAFLFTKEGRDILTASGVTLIPPKIVGDRSAVPATVLGPLTQPA